MRPLCYTFALAADLLPALEALVTRLRLAVVAGLSAALGGVFVGGCRLMDSRSSVLATVGAGAVLGVALLVDALRPREGAGVAAEVRGLHERLDRLEAEVGELAVAVAGARTSADAALRARGSRPE